MLAAVATSIFGILGLGRLLGVLFTALGVSCLLGAPVCFSTIRTAIVDRRSMLCLLRRWPWLASSHCRNFAREATKATNKVAAESI